MTRFKIGDIVLTPDDSIATVVYLPDDGTIAVETPWDANWTRYRPDELCHPDNGE